MVIRIEGKENLLPPHGLLFLISSTGPLINSSQVQDSHTTAFVIPVVDNWIE